MAANEERAAAGAVSLKRLRLALVVAVALLVAGVVALFLLRPHDTTGGAAATGIAAVTWAAGEKQAPNFRLTDEDGSPVSISRFRGRSVIVTFVDPHCTTFCPRESVVLNDALHAFPAAERPAIVAVSVDPKTRSLNVLRSEARRFKWLPQWHWAAGSALQLNGVWRAYNIQVVPAADDIGHTEAAYLVDKNGDQRALFLWPFKADEIAAALRRIS
jgi:cytochrome oxidase Cu insertion factor (SCO1/SenC/PrrC family)